MLPTNASPASNDIFEEKGKFLITKKLIFLQTEFARLCLELTRHKVKFHINIIFQKNLRNCSLNIDAENQGSYSRSEFTVN